MTEPREPRPVGNEQTAWVRLLQRARTAEAALRDTRAELAALRAVQGHQEDQ